MSEEIDIESWMAELVERMCYTFGERLALVGIQGSRARGEARADSDIDAVVAVEGLSPEERMFLDAYDDPGAFDADELANALLTWSASVVE